MASAARQGRDERQRILAGLPPRPISVEGPPVSPERLSGLGVPPLVIKTTAWALCLIILLAAGDQLLALLAFFSEVTVPLAIAILTTALAAPAVDVLVRLGVHRGLAAGLVVLLGVVVVFGLLTLVGTQVAAQATRLSDDVVTGLGQIQDWLRDGPLGLSDAQLSAVITSAQNTVQGAGGSEVVARAGEVGTTVTRVFTGAFIVLFATFFFCAQGGRIWTWLVNLFPQSAQYGLDASGRVAWVSLTAFVRATILVALTDAVGIAVGALIIGVPLALPLGVLVFLGAFVPIVGAAVSGAVAVLVALVAQGPVIALVMLGVVVAVQQLESHVLQPFLMGRLVAVHPLAIILAIAVGLVAGGIVGALIAVPIAACGNAVRKFWAGHAAAPDVDTPSAVEPSPDHE
jgi:predicted PurR-regulated permease PerM